MERAPLLAFSVDVSVDKGRSTTFVPSISILPRRVIFLMPFSRRSTPIFL
jgi:hypothetical protein